MKPSYDEEQQQMDLSLTEQIEALPELSRHETASVQTTLPQDESELPQSDLRPRPQRKRPVSKPLPDSRYAKAAELAAAEAAQAQRAKEAAERPEPSVNPHARETLMRRLSQPQIMLETPYSVSTKHGAKLRYRLEYGRPEEPIPPEQQSLSETDEPLEQTALAPEVLEERAKEERSKTIWKNVLEWVRLIALALVIGLLIRQFVFVFAWVEGGSMLNTLNDNEYLLVTRYEYYFRQPKRQEIVICHYPNYNVKTNKMEYSTKNYVKRVIGLPGEHVELREGVVYINGEALEEGYTFVDEAAQTAYPVSSIANADYGTVPDGYVFVMGDHRNNSLDSRRVGFIKISEIIGHARLVVYPFGKIRSVTP